MLLNTPLTYLKQQKNILKIVCFKRVKDQLFWTEIYTSSSSSASSGASDSEVSEVLASELPVVGSIPESRNKLEKFEEPVCPCRQSDVFVYKDMFDLAQACKRKRSPRYFRPLFPYLGFRGRGTYPSLLQGWFSRFFHILFSKKCLSWVITYY